MGNYVEAGRRMGRITGKKRGNGENTKGMKGEHKTFNDHYHTSHLNDHGNIIVFNVMRALSNI